MVPGDLHLCCVTEHLSRCNHRLARFWEETIGRVNPQIRPIVNYLTFSGSIKVAAAETMNHLVVEDKWILKMEHKIETFEYNFGDFQNSLVYSTFISIASAVPVRMDTLLLA